MRRSRAVTAWCALLLPLASAAPAVAADDGRALYLRYCAACHGREGRGDGPVAPALGERPTDLTQLAAENDGKFPMDEVVEAVDGTRTVRAHGVSEMPVWGEVLRGASGDAPDQFKARDKVLVIVDYLRSLQKPAAAR
jgi:mono/diheme cytochrome c family protein